MKNRLLQIQQIIFTLIFVAGMIHFLPNSQFIAWGFMFVGWGAFLFTDVWAGGYYEHSSFAFFWVITLPVIFSGLAPAFSSGKLSKYDQIIPSITALVSIVYCVYFVERFRDWSRKRRDRRIKRLDSLNYEFNEFNKNIISEWDEEQSIAWSKMRTEISKLSTGWITPEAP